MSLTELKDSICGQSNVSTKDLILLIFFFFFEFMQQDVFPFIGEKKRLLWERGEGNEMG